MLGKNILHKFLVKFVYVLGEFKNRLKISFKFSLQIHRRAEAGRDLRRSSGPASLLKQSQLPRTMSRRLWSIFKDGDSTTISDNLCYAWLPSKRVP